MANESKLAGKALPGTENPPAEGLPRDTIRILLVDDHRENVLALEAVLKDLGHNLVAASSGAEALKHILDEDFAVILLDVRMPDMDGFETAELIRRRERSRHTPIIFMTAVSKGETFVDRGYAGRGRRLSRWSSRSVPEILPAGVLDLRRPFPGRRLRSRSRRSAQRRASRGASTAESWPRCGRSATASSLSRWT